MAIIRAAQPGYYPRINRANPLTRALRFALHGPTFRDAYLGTYGTPSGTVVPVLAARAAGQTVLVSKSAQIATYSYLNFGAHVPTADLGWNNNPATFAVYARDSTGGGGGLIERNDGNTVSAGWSIFKSYGADYIQFYKERSISNTKIISNSQVWSDRVGFHSVVVSTDGSLASAGMKMYFDGLSIPFTEQSALGSGTSSSDASNNLYIGRDVYSGGCLSGEIAIAVIANRIWSPAEV